VDAAPKKRVLILCTGNSCRSPMAAGLVNQLLGERWQAFSAGTHPALAVHPLAVRTLAEVGVDIADATPQALEAFLDQRWDLVITVCDSARESCPVFPRPVEQIHLPFPDPVLAVGSEEERLAAFRAVRDDINSRLIPELRRRDGSVGGL
jgi:arsenate reductase